MAKENIPDLEMGWSQIWGGYRDPTGTEWRCYTKPQRNSPDWKTVKVVAVGAVPGRANYWLYRNEATGKTARLKSAMGRDMRAMRDDRPGLYRWVMKGLHQLARNTGATHRAPASKRDTDNLEVHRKAFQQAWRAAGAQRRNGAPYLGRTEALAWRGTQQQLGAARRFIAELLAAKAIAPCADGWVRTST